MCKKSKSFNCKTFDKSKFTKKRELKPQWSWWDFFNESLLFWINSSFIYFVACKRSRWFLWYNRTLVICAGGSETWLVKKKKTLFTRESTEKSSVRLKYPIKKKLMIYHQRETCRTENFPAKPRIFYFILFCLSLIINIILFFFLLLYDVNFVNKPFQLRGL